MVTLNEKNLWRFLIIITRNGSLMPNTLEFSIGQEMKLVLTFDPMISKTEHLISGSIYLLM